MQTLLDQAAAVQSATGLSGRRLCALARLSRASFGRWRRRQRDHQPLLQSPGPPKTQPLPLAQVRQQIQQLAHGSKRTQGTAALYQEHRDSLSRRQLATLVEQERQHQQDQRRATIKHVTWHAVQTAWALDSTEWPTTQPGLKLQVLAARDLASQYSLDLQADPHLLGHQVADYLAQLIDRHGPPLFLKRDNAAVLHTPALEALLAHTLIIPLDSPVHYPPYNGAIEKQIGDLKRSFPFNLPVPPAAQPLLQALRHQFNASPRPGLLDCSPAQMFHGGLRHCVNRPTRSAIFDWICNRARCILSHMNEPDQPDAACAWRHAVQDWLLSQSLITITTHHETDNQINQLLPLFPK